MHVVVHRCFRHVRVQRDGQGHHDEDDHGIDPIGRLMVQVARARPRNHNVLGHEHGERQGEDHVVKDKGDGAQDREGGLHP